MSFEIQPFGDLPEDLAKQIADMIAAYTKGELGEAPQMLPVEPSDICKKYMGCVALQDGAPAGYIGALAPDVWNGQRMTEVGSLVVLPEYRKQGLAHQLVKFITKTLAANGDVPYAFCNPKSLPIFADAGYVDAITNDVPPSAFSACSTCPMQPANGCCDHVMILKGENL